MNARAEVIRQLLGESLYFVDEAAVAEAIVLRAGVRRAVPGFEFRAAAVSPVGSSARADSLRWFRLSGTTELRPLSR